MAARSVATQTLLGGKLRLIRRIGHGGMGDVWIARNEATQADVAVKTLLRDRTDVHDERFRREARLAATLSHRNVVRIFDLVDESDGTLGLVMELLHGDTLEGCMKKRGPLSSVAAVGVALQVLSALHHVHQKGIVHRDMKPANVFFAVEPDGHVIPKVLDFGIAKLPAAGSALTVDGSVLGTPHYMSPEQIRGQEVDGRSDMFSLAVVLYEALTGVRVFHRETAAASLAAVLEHQVDPDSRIEPRVWLVLSRALAKRPYERYASCAELGEALRDAVDASDEDLQEAVQSLRPDVPQFPLEDVSTSAIIGRRKDSGRFRRRTFVVALSVVSASVVVAVLLTLAMTKRPPVEDVPSRTEPVAMPSFADTPSATPPPSTMLPAEVTSSPAGTQRAVVPSRPPTPATKATTTSHKPAPTAKPTTKPVATSPGF